MQQRTTTNMNIREAAMQSTNFIEYVSKTNNGLFIANKIAITLWNNLHNQVKSINSYNSYRKYIKSMLTNMYL